MRGFNPKRTDRKNVSYLGAAGAGSGHWWAQRMTALIMLPLAVWLMVSLCGLVGQPQAAVTAWMGSLVNATLLLILLPTILLHSALGLQVVIEDYVHSHWLKLGAILLIRFVFLLLAVGLVIAVLRVALGG
ncbi:MAG: succinate dehydrogenase, hydrophobic membrane anchor protein [Gammaproteobacteria bacterium]|nr:succinate dehydrogenase, hydrophobic membrane anchor protein [Gammaproteobacteria bacterium]